MKSVIILIVLLSTIFCIETNAWTKRVAKDGRDNGGGSVTYSYIKEVRTDNYTDIWCEHPGGENCPKLVAGGGRSPDQTTMNEQVCLDHAFGEIEQGNLSGSWTDPSTNFHVTWTAAGIDSDIRVWGPGESEPE